MEVPCVSRSHRITAGAARLAISPSESAEQAPRTGRRTPTRAAKMSEGARSSLPPTAEVQASAGEVLEPGHSFDSFDAYKLRASKDPYRTGGSERRGARRQCIRIDGEANTWQCQNCEELQTILPR